MLLDSGALPEGTPWLWWTCPGWMPVLIRSVLPDVTDLLASCPGLVVPDRSVPPPGPTPPDPYDLVSRPIPTALEPQSAVQHPFWGT